MEMNIDTTIALPTGPSTTVIHYQSTQFITPPISFLTQDNTKYDEEHIANKSITITTSIANPRPPAQV